MAINNSLLVDLSGLDVKAKSYTVGASTQGGGFHSVSDLYNGATTSVTTTSTTATIAVILGSVLVNSNAAAVTITLDTAANIVAGVNSATAGANVNDLIEFTIINGGSTSGAITVAAGTGGSFDANVPAANRTIAINTQKQVFVKLTNVTSGSEAYTIYM